MSTLMNLRLIDEMHLIVIPVVLGNGKPLFKNIEFRHKMNLVAARTFSSGVVALHHIKEPERSP